MSHLSFILSKIERGGDADAIIAGDRSFSYQFLRGTINIWRAELDRLNVTSGSIVGLRGEMEPFSISLLLALIDRGCIVLPFCGLTEVEERSRVEIAGGNVLLKASPERIHATEWEKADEKEVPVLVEELRSRCHPGIVFFSSGSTGVPKAALHDLLPLLLSFERRRWKPRRMLAFLLFDHIGGVNTLLASLAAGGTLVTVTDRQAKAVVDAVVKWKVQVLPTSPSFINLLLLSEAYKGRDLSSLELMTYGTEPMPESTLKRFSSLFPSVRTLQTYGLSEVGILRSQSESNQSLWLKLGGDGFETRVRNGCLEIKAVSAMMGYLNAESPFTSDGWFMTGDRVDQRGDYFRIYGREKEVINVGGNKLYPVDVEGVILDLPGVDDVVVSGEPHPILGEIVKATVCIHGAESLSSIKERIRKHCQSRMPRYMIPQRVEISTEPLCGVRMKRHRVSPNTARNMTPIPDFND